MTTTEHKIMDQATAQVPAAGAHYVPLGISFDGLNCLVVGAGRVGARKALALGDGGAKVTVLAPTAADRVRRAAAAGRLRWERAEYDASWLDGNALVVAATADPELNICIARDAERRGVLHCVVSPGRFSRVIFPAVHANGRVQVAVHSNGTDCAESRRVRDRIAGLLDGSESVPEDLALFGVRRPDLPQEAFERVRSAATEPVREAGLLVLSTCRRWECYGSAASPAAVARRVRRLVHERAGLLLESWPGALYVKGGAGAYHHLVRVAAGLDSPLLGETDVVGQVRAALAGPSGDEVAAARSAVEAALLAQRRLRRDSGLAAERRTWADAAVTALAARLPSLPASCVLLVGCGRLSGRIACRLRQQGAEVVALSRRAAAGVDWCRTLEVEVRPLTELPRLLPSAHAIVLANRLPGELARAVARAAGSGALAVLDLAGSHSASFRAAGHPNYVGLEDMARTAMSGVQVARVAVAERLALLHAARWAGRRAPASPAGRIAVGARASQLSQAQVAEVKELLGALAPHLTVRAVEFETPGDRDKRTPLPRAADDFFTRDLDEALLAGAIDVAVHSAKDLPARTRAGLHVAAVTRSLAPWECLITRDGRRLEHLPARARVGTSSERRRGRLLALRLDLLPVEVRGNVPARLAQLDEGRYDALVLAAVGLVRLGLEERISQVFGLDEFPPAPGQGQLALVVREDDEELQKLLHPLDLGSREGLPWT